MDDTVKRLALRMKIHKVEGTVVHHVALLKRILDQKGHKAEIIKGYCVIEQTKEACEHYWCRVNGLDLDIGFQVACLRSPELSALHPVLLEDLPPGLLRSDSEAILVLKENHRLYTQHQQDPRAFWREAPKSVSGLRAS